MIKAKGNGWSETIWMELEIQVIDATDVSRPNERESFWIEKLNTYCPRGLNI